MLLFLDAEFANADASDLVSLALVSECGQFEFYAERDPLPSSPSHFVRQVIYPPLNRGAHALHDDEFTRKLHAFFDRVMAVSKYGKVLVAYDHRIDVQLLDHALAGFPSAVTSKSFVCDTFNLELLGGEYDVAVERIFESDSGLREHRHHALIDAWVNRDAYLAVRKLSSERSVAEIVAESTLRRNRERLR